MCSERAKLIYFIIGSIKLAVAVVITVSTSSLSFSKYFEGLNYTYENKTGYVIKSNITTNNNTNSNNDQCTVFTYDQYKYLTESIGIFNESPSIHSNLNRVLIKIYFFMGVIILTTTVITIPYFNYYGLKNKSRRNIKEERKNELKKDKLDRKIARLENSIEQINERHDCKDLKILYLKELNSLKSERDPCFLIKLIKDQFNNLNNIKDNISTILFFLNENLIVSHFFAISMIDFNTNCITLNIKLVPIVFFDISIYYLLAYYFTYIFILIISIPFYIFSVKKIDNGTDEDEDEYFLGLKIYLIFVFLFIFPTVMISLVLYIVSFLGGLNSIINTVLGIVNSLINFYMFFK